MKNAKKLSLIVLVIALLGINLAAAKGKLHPLPAPIPTSCPGDVLCW